MQNYENIRNEIRRLQEQNRSIQVSVEKFFKEDTTRQGQEEIDVSYERTIKKLNNRNRETRYE